MEKEIVKDDIQSFISEHEWMTRWFTEIIKNKNNIIITDRSPISASIYCNDGGKLIKECILKYRQCLKKKNVFIYTCFLNVEKKMLWERIQKRLKTEPFRSKYKEDSKDWLDLIHKKYTEFNEWDYIIKNGKPNIYDVIDIITKKYSH